MNDGDRRRLSLAALLTLVALPALWVLGRESAPTTTAPAAGAAGVQTASLVGGNDDASTTSTTAYVPRSPVFLDGSVMPTVAPPMEVQHGTAPNGNHLTVRATFRRFANAGGSPCSTPLAPAAATITVRNIANGQKVTCRNNRSVEMPADIGIVLHTDLFATISSLADAPISVDISW